MSRPLYLLAASVPPGNRVRRFFDTGAEGAAFLLMSVDRFRSGSFDVAIPDTPKEGPEGSQELRWGDRKLLRLYQDGTLLFRAAADEEFLGWGVDQRTFARWPRLNPVAVVEVNTSFVHFYRKVLLRLKQQPDTVSIKLSIEHGALDQRRLYLTRYYQRGIQNVVEPEQFALAAHPPEAELSAQPMELIERPNRTAYRVIREFADLFDLPEALIPFQHPGPDGPEVALEEIIALR